MGTRESKKIVEEKNVVQLPPRRGRIKEKIFGELAKKVIGAVGRENNLEGKSKGGVDSGSSASSITHPLISSFYIPEGKKGI